jgi:inner membrane protein involved in colicin E2 resistance
MKSVLTAFACVFSFAFLTLLVGMSLIYFTGVVIGLPSDIGWTRACLATSAAGATGLGLLFSLVEASGLASAMQELREYHR